MQVIESLEKIVGLSPFNTNYVFRRKHQKKKFPYAVHSFAQSLLVPYQNFNYFLLNAFMATISRSIACYLRDHLAAFHVEKVLIWKRIIHHKFLDNELEARVPTKLCGIQRVCFWEVVLRVISDVEAKDGKFGRSMYEIEYTLPCFHQVLFNSVSSVLFGWFVATQLVKFSNVREEPISVLWCPSFISSQSRTENERQYCEILSLSAKLQEDRHILT